MSYFHRQLLLLTAVLLSVAINLSYAWIPSPSASFSRRTFSKLNSSTKNNVETTETMSSTQADPAFDYQVPDDAVVVIQPNAMKRLRELRDKQEANPLILRMGVRSGGCSGMSYVMDFESQESIQEDDVVDEYSGERIQCVVDAKSMLYLYGLQLDYSDELIGGGFKFYNPNAEESCGCGSSFAV
ncbi:hypothetical protein MPSEU_000199800 [Mayamaea pseudoterrestris]|nr:hypothetical protein MPSEU_000199800 [Mayamaea pseudoterrestris]